MSWWAILLLNYLSVGVGINYIAFTLTPIEWKEESKLDVAVDIIVGLLLWPLLPWLSRQ